METQDLRNAGLKVTLPRIKILEMLENRSYSGRHLTAEEVYKSLIQGGEEIGLATVYRVLTQFEAAGLVKRHHFEGGNSVFELNRGDHHDHMVCVKCGRVQEFSDELIEQRQREIAQAKGFTLTEHSLCLYGVCADCATPATSSGSNESEGQMPSDALDVATRLESLAELRDGWLDGAGVAPDKAGLNWLAGMFQGHFSAELPSPYLYPTAEGGVQAEWPLGDWEVSLEIDLCRKFAEWQALHLTTQKCAEARLDLSGPDDWQALNRKLRALVPSAL